MVKNLPANAGAAGDVGSIPRSWRSPAEGNGTPLQYSCLENSTDREAWRATVHRAAKSQTGLNNWVWAQALNIISRLHSAVTRRLFKTSSQDPLGKQNMSGALKERLPCWPEPENTYIYMERERERFIFMICRGIVHGVAKSRTQLSD